MEETLIEIPSTRPFTGITLMPDRIPEKKILTFRHLLEKQKLGDKNLENVNPGLMGFTINE